MNSTNYSDPYAIYFTTPLAPFQQTPWKIASVTFILILLTLVWILVGLAAWNRNYPPIRSKGILLIIAMVIGDTVGVIGEFWDTQVLDQTGYFFLESGYGCSFLICFPSLLSLVSVNIQNYRMYRLHFIVNRRLPIHSFRFWLPFVLSNIPLILYSALIMVPGNPYITLTPMNDPWEYGCNLAPDTNDFIGGLAAIAELVILLFGLYTAVQLRRLSLSLNESKQMIGIYLWLFIGYILYIINISTPISDTIPGKFFNLIYEMILPIRLCAILVKPVWNCYFNNEAYLKQWKAGLKAPKDYKEANMRFGEKQKSAGGRQIPNREIGKPRESVEMAKKEEKVSIEGTC